MSAERPEHESPLDDVIASYLEALESGLRPDRREWLARYPQFADELAAFFADEARFDGLLGPLRATPAPSAVVTQNGATPLPRLLAAAPGRGFGEYEILEEVGRGGMGIVYKARQRSLNRVVALKTIRDAEWATPDDVQRFRLEAEAVALLDHPNIVPVYEVSAHGGQHYFSMKWIDGGSLAHSLERGDWSAADAGCQRAAAELIATVARAVHHAHERGILHRDLKPANILLQQLATDEHGLKQIEKENNILPPFFIGLHPCSSVANFIPFVTDFGLAKRFGDDHKLTQSGVAVGTPSYMAPEQAAPGATGRGAALTVAADVYSLGAILYELLTGQPPFRGATLLETLRDVLERDPPRPRDLLPRLDRDLETICLKCLDKAPARRYASAQALADDLGRWLAGESIAARPVGRVEAAARWCRRNPVVAGLALLATAALLSVTGMSLLWALRESGHVDDLREAAAKLSKEKQQTEAALAAARGERDKAEQERSKAERSKAKADQHKAEAEERRRLQEQSFRLAHAAVNEFCTGVADELRGTPSLEPVRRRLLESALNYYKEFVKDRGQDPALKFELAGAYANVARIVSAAGRKADALAAYQTSRALYQELADAKPDDPQVQYRLAATDYDIGVVLGALGRPEARASYEKALAVGERLRSVAGQDTGLKKLLADCHAGLASLHRAAGELNEALAAYTRARDMHQVRAKERPKDLRVQGELALACNNLGVIHRDLRQPKEALKCFEHARDLREQCAAADMAGVGIRVALAASLRDLGVTHNDLGNHDEALSYLERARAMRAAAAREAPNIAQYQADLAASHRDVGLSLERRKKFKEALACFRDAEAVLERLAAADPGALYPRRDLAQIQFSIGNLHANFGQRPEAIAAFARGAALLEDLVKSHPNNLQYRNDLAALLNNQALAVAKEGRLDEARALLHKALAHSRLIFERRPASGEFRATFGTNLGMLAEVERVACRWAEAVAATQERRKLWPNSANEQYKAAVELARVVRFYDDEGKKKLTDEQRAERGRYADLVLDALRQAAALGFGDARRMEREPALAVVREREDFRNLLADLKR